MCSASGCHRFAVAGFPIRTSPDHRLYTATRGFSQCPTSFFGTWRQGILRKLLVAFLRDAEKSKLLVTFFLLAPWRCCFRIQQQLPYSLVKVLMAARQFIRRYPPSSGDDGTRTRDFRLAKAALSQLSYIPNIFKVVGLTGFEPVTPALSAQCSNHLSYRPTGTSKTEE